jgi:PST family polysaccharide transporter
MTPNEAAEPRSRLHHLIAGTLTRARVKGRGTAPLSGAAAPADLAPHSVESSMRVWRKLEQVATLVLHLALGRLYPLIILPILAVRIGPDGMGLYVQLLAIGLIFGQFVEWGFSISGPRDIAFCKTRDATSLVVFNVIFARLMLAALVSLAAVVVYFGLTDGKFGAAEFFLAVLYGMSIASDFRFLFYGLNLFRRQLFIQVLQNGLALLLIVFFVHTSEDVWKIFLLSSVAVIIALLASWLALGREIAFSAARKATPIRQLGRTFDVFLSRGAVQIMNQVPPLIFGLFYSNAVVGQIALSEKIVKTFGQMTMFVFMHAMVRDLAKLLDIDRVRAFRVFLLGNGVVLLACLAFAAAIFVLADPIISILFGTGFLPMREYLAIFLVFCVPFTLSRTFGFYWLFLSKADRTNTYISIAFLVACLSVILVLSSAFPPSVPLWFLVAAWTALLAFYAAYIFAQQLDRPA